MDLTRGCRIPSRPEIILSARSVEAPEAADGVADTIAADVPGGSPDFSRIVIRRGHRSTVEFADKVDVTE